MTTGPLLLPGASLDERVNDYNNGHYKTLTDAAKGASQMLAPLQQDTIGGGLEIGADLYCTQSGCGWKNARVGQEPNGQDAGAVALTSQDAALWTDPQTTAAGFWHMHPPNEPNAVGTLSGDDPTSDVAGHNTEMYHAYASLPQDMHFSMYTLNQNGLFVQNYQGASSVSTPGIQRDSSYATPPAQPVAPGSPIVVRL